MSETPADDSVTSRGAMAKWLVTALLFMAAAAFLSAHATNRVKLLVLFALAFSAGTAWALSRLAIMMQVRLRAAVISCTAAIVLAGLVSQSVIAHHEFAADVRQQFATNPIDLLVAKTTNGSGTANPEANRVMEKSHFEREQRLQEMSSFPAYLQRRILALGWPPPFGIVIFIAELVSGTALATWCASLVFRRAT